MFPAQLAQLSQKKDAEIYILVLRGSIKILLGWEAVKVARPDKSDQIFRLGSSQE